LSLICSSPSFWLNTSRSALKKFITRLACIFTQSIQLSNIILGCICSLAALGGCEHLIFTLCKSEASRCSMFKTQLSAFSH
jgi:hypothetical protein